MNQENTKTVMAVVGAIAAVLAGNTGMTYNNGKDISALTEQNNKILTKIEALVDTKVIPATALASENRELNKQITNLVIESNRQNAEIIGILKILTESKKGK